jgi:hypothetical protein
MLLAAFRPTFPSVSSAKVVIDKATGRSLYPKLNHLLLRIKRLGGH